MKKRLNITIVFFVLVLVNSVSFALANETGFFYGTRVNVIKIKEGAELFLNAKGDNKIDVYSSTGEEKKIVWQLVSGHACYAVSIKDGWMRVVFLTDKILEKDGDGTKWKEVPFSYYEGYIKQSDAGGRMGYATLEIINKDGFEKRKLNEENIKLLMGLNQIDLTFINFYFSHFNDEVTERLVKGVPPYYPGMEIRCPKYILDKIKDIIFKEAEIKKENIGLSKTEQKKPIEPDKEKKNETVSLAREKEKVKIVTPPNQKLVEKPKEEKTVVQKAEKKEEEKIFTLNINFSAIQEKYFPNADKKIFNLYAICIGLTIIITLVLFYLYRSQISISYFLIPIFIASLGCFFIYKQLEKNNSDFLYPKIKKIIKIISE